MLQGIFSQVPDPPRDPLGGDTLTLQQKGRFARCHSTAFRSGDSEIITDTGETRTLCDTPLVRLPMLTLAQFEIRRGRRSIGACLIKEVPRKSPLFPRPGPLPCGEEDLQGDGNQFF